MQQNVIPTNWQPEHVFALKQSLALYDLYQRCIDECDTEIERTETMLNIKQSSDPHFDIHAAMYHLGLKSSLWPGYHGPFVRKHAFADVGDEAVPFRELLVGSFGLIPHWSKDATIARRTYNARSETAHEKPSYRDAWRLARHCIIPAEAIYEPDWTTGKAVATRIVRADGLPMGIAGLWSAWRNPDGEMTHSYTMLTINADAHPFMRRFHKPEDEKRMVVILDEGNYDAWLQAPANETSEFLRPFPADGLVAQ